MTNAIKSQRKYNRDVYSYCGNGEQLRSQSIPRLSGILNACGSTSGAIVDITAHARKRRSAGASCKQKKKRSPKAPLWVFLDGSPTTLRAAQAGSRGAHQM